MKRSEMINFIASYFYDCLNINQKESLAHAEDLLDGIEEVGMLPPHRVGTYDRVPTVTPTGNHDYSWKREWEPENDKG